MKKLVFMFVAMAAISFASCNENKPAQAPEAEVVDTTVVDTAVVDSAAAAVDTTVAQYLARIKKSEKTVRLRAWRFFVFVPIGL